MENTLWEQRIQQQALPRTGVREKEKGGSIPAEAAVIREREERSHSKQLSLHPRHLSTEQVGTLTWHGTPAPAAAQSLAVDSTGPLCVCWILEADR